jgi:hypothetical protein
MENDMKKLLAALAATAATLFATAAFPENAVWEQRAELQRAWDNSQARAAAPGDLLARVFGQVEFPVAESGSVEVGSNNGRSLHSDTGYGEGAGSGNYRGGRAYDSTRR